MRQKKPTIYDIANYLGISTGTVCRALNNTGRISEKTKEKVLLTAKKLGYKANEAARSLQREPIFIGVIICCPIQQYLENIELGINTAFNELSKCNVYSDIRNLGNKNAYDCKNEIMEILNDFESKNYNGIILFLSGNTSFFTDKINELSSKGIKIATVANDIPDAKTALTVSADGVAAGMLAAEILKLCCEGKKVALLTGSSKTAIHHSNIKGFMEYIEGKNIFLNVELYEHGDNSTKAKKIIDELFLSENLPDGIYITSAISQYICSYIESLNLKVYPKIIMTDLFAENRRLLKNGLACATIFQDPFKQGKQVVERLYDVIDQNIQESENFLIIPQAVFASNMKMYAR